MGHTSEQVSIPSGAGTIPGYLALPEGESPAPGIVLLSDMFGPTEFYRKVASDLAGRGYATLLPDLFTRLEPLPENTSPHGRARLQQMPDNLAAQDIGAAIEFLKDHPRTRGQRVGTIGFCMGGTWVLVMAALRTDLSAGVCLYGFPVQRETAPWKIYQPVDMVEHFSHPILGIWGDQDGSIPLEHVEQLRAEMERCHKPHQVVVYPGAQHSFMVEPGYGIPARDPGPGVREDAWSRVYSFLSEALQDQEPKGWSG